ncbi:MAG: hypothetical protein ACOX41_01730 [Anaerovoracaceae bacterium]|jgi:hypothetical protein
MIFILLYHEKVNSLMLYPLLSEITCYRHLIYSATLIILSKYRHSQSGKQCLVGPPPLTVNRHARPPACRGSAPIPLIVPLRVTAARSVPERLQRHPISLKNISNMIFHAPYPPVTNYYFRISRGIRGIIFLIVAAFHFPEPTFPITYGILVLKI